MGRGQAAAAEVAAPLRRITPPLALAGPYLPIAEATREELAEVVAAHQPFLSWYAARDGAAWPPPLIRDEAALARAVDELRALSPRVVALDLETASRGYWNSRERAHGSIRLAQFAVDEPERGIHPRQWLVDCHAVDASPLFQLLADPAVETQVFNLQFEVEKLASRAGVEIGNVYDPCLAWRYIQKRMAELDEPARAALGFPGLKKRPRGNWATPFYENKLSVLAPLLLELQLAKDDQESDWGAADLSEGQLLYATIDVATLPALTERTKDVAAALGLTDTIAAKTEQARAKVVAELREPRAFAEDEADRLASQLALARTRAELETVWNGRRQLAITHRSLTALETVYDELAAEFELRVA